MLLATPMFALALLAGLAARPRDVAAPPAVEPVQAIVQSQAPLGATFACYQRAHDRTRLDEGSIVELCRGAADAGPVDCFLAARDRTRLANDEAMALCRCATSTEPVMCFDYGRQSTTLDRGRVLSLCAPEERFELDAACRAPRR